MRSKSVEEVFNGELKLKEKDLLPFLPVIDGDVIPDSPSNLYRNGIYNKVSSM